MKSKLKHVHRYVIGQSKKVSICRCGAFRHEGLAPSDIIHGLCTALAGAVDHEINPGRLVPGGAICTGCGGLVPDKPIPIAEGV